MSASVKLVETLCARTGHAPDESTLRIVVGGEVANCSCGLRRYVRHHDTLVRVINSQEFASIFRKRERGTPH
jgi:hypothetical protein